MFALQDHLPAHAVAKNDSKVKASMPLFLRANPATARGPLTERFGRPRWQTPRNPRMAAGRTITAWPLAQPGGAGYIAATQTSH
jgi:hypothetical protein